MGVTARFRDKFLFKVPSLRQVNATSPYMHDGSISTLAEVVDAYIDASVSDHQNLDNNMLPIELNDAEKQELISFLNVL
jgi:cytochrome c peroxidase